MNCQQRRAAERRTQRNSGTSLAPDEVFRAAVASHQAGRLAEAAATCQALLSASPRHADCLHLYGVLEMQLGHAAAAADLIARAIALRPNHAEAHADRGDALAALQAIMIWPWRATTGPLRSSRIMRRRGATVAIPSAVSAVSTMRWPATTAPSRCARTCPRPGAIVGWHWLDLGCNDDAIASFDRAISLRPAMAEAGDNRGVALAKTGRLGGGRGELRPRARGAPNSTRRPGRTEVWRYSRWNAQAMPLPVLRPCDTAWRPDLAEAGYNRGNALQMLEEAALHSYDRATALRADYPEALSERVHVRYLTCDWRHRPEDDAGLIDLVHRNQTVAPFLLLATSASPADQLRCSRQWATRFARARRAPLAGSQPRQIRSGRSRWVIYPGIFSPASAGVSDGTCWSAMTALGSRSLCYNSAGG